MILKLAISLIFVAAAAQKFTGKVASNWERWGYSRRFMYGTGIAEIVAVAFFWGPGLELVGAAGFVLVLFGALVTLVKHREGADAYGPERVRVAPGAGAVVSVLGCMTRRRRS